MMTEQEWLAATDPDAMLETVAERAAPRKLCLFTCSCLRRVWDLLGDDRSKRAVAVAEAYADGRASRDELRRAEREAQKAARKAGLAGEVAVEAVATAWAAEAAGAARQVAGKVARGVAGTAAREVALEVAWGVAADLAAGVTGEMARAEEEEAQAGLLRCVFGNPFRSRLALDPAIRKWHDGAVVKLAEAIYGSQNFTDLPVLADLLEEAGVTDPDLLAHCRSPGPHARGCFALDLILNRSSPRSTNGGEHSGRGVGMGAEYPSVNPIP
jgi:hypothetical protein